MRQYTSVGTGVYILRFLRLSAHGIETTSQAVSQDGVAHVPSVAFQAFSVIVETNSPAHTTSTDRTLRQTRGC